MSRYSYIVKPVALKRLKIEVDKPARRRDARRVLSGRETLSKASRLRTGLIWRNLNLSGSPNR